MGPDQAFAAHMWTWPDAAIKRDASGAVLFVNAAFLALYGGRAEDWHGMAVSGWNAPPHAGQSQRFETRIPSQIPEYPGERVYDWIESAMADGSALAIARDVTDVAVPPGGEPVIEEITPPVAQFQAPPITHDPTPPAAEITQPAFEPVMEEPPSAQDSLPTIDAAPAPALDQALVQNDPVIAETVADVTPVPAEAVEPQAPTVEAPAMEAPDPFGIDDFDEILDVNAAPPPPAVDAAPTVEAAPLPEAAPEPEPVREFERRPLPVEDSNAVLGTNWRDAVIAKAVGVSDDEIDESAAPAAPAPVPQSSTSGDTTRILLAEDNAINALLTRTLLEAEGCVVDTVEDGALAVEAIRAKTYDLIFMDMRMPNMDGLDATRKIRSLDHASKGLPIIALTANAFDDDRNACFDAGMNDFMTKPVSAEELSEMVTRWTSESADLQAATA